MVIVEAESRLGWQVTTRALPSFPRSNNISDICIQSDPLASRVGFPNSFIGVMSFIAGVIAQTRVKSRVIFHGNS